MLNALFTSKKFVASLAGVIVGLIAQLGLDLDQQAVATILAPLMAYIVGQGIADHGKEREKFKQQAGTV